MYDLDPDAREYVEISKTPLITSFARRIARPHVRYSGRTVDIYYDTFDTGERRQFLGYTAKHLFLRERQIAELGACASSSFKEEDGWYIDFPEVPSNYRKVDHFRGEVPPTWTERLSWGWTQVLDAVATWF